MATADEEATPNGRSPIACESCAKAKTGCDKKVPCGRCRAKRLQCRPKWARRASKHLIERQEGASPLPDSVEAAMRSGEGLPMKVQPDATNEHADLPVQAWANGQFQDNPPIASQMATIAQAPTQQLMPESWSRPDELWSTGMLPQSPAYGHGYHADLGMNDPLHSGVFEHRASYMSAISCSPIASSTTLQVSEAWRFSNGLSCSGQVSPTFMSGSVPCTLLPADNALSASPSPSRLNQQKPLSQMCRLVWLRKMLLPSQRDWCIDNFIADLNLGQVTGDLASAVKEESAAQLCSTLGRMLQDSIRLLTIRLSQHTIAPHTEFGGESLSFLSARHLTCLVQSGLTHLGHYTPLRRAINTSFLEIAYHPTHIDWLMTVAQGLLCTSFQASQELGLTLLEVCCLSLKHHIVTPTCWSVALFAAVAGWSGNKQLEHEAVAMSCSEFSHLDSVGELQIAILPSEGCLELPQIVSTEQCFILDLEFALLFNRDSDLTTSAPMSGLAFDDTLNDYPALRQVQSGMDHLWQSFHQTNEAESPLGHTQRELMLLLIMLQRVSHLATLCSSLLPESQMNSQITELLAKWHRASLRSAISSSQHIATMTLYSFLCLNQLVDFPSLESAVHGNSVETQGFSPKIVRSEVPVPRLSLAREHCCRILCFLEQLQRTIPPAWWPQAVYRASLILWRVSLDSAYQVSDELPTPDPFDTLVSPSPFAGSGGIPPLQMSSFGTVEPAPVGFACAESAYVGGEGSQFFGSPSSFGDTYLRGPNGILERGFNMVKTGPVSPLANRVMTRLKWLQDMSGAYPSPSVI